jgi:hypothetical protein
MLCRLCRQKNPHLKKLFNIGYKEEPVIKIFSGSRYYKFPLKAMQPSIDNLQAFISDFEYHAERTERMKVWMPTLWEELNHWWKQEVEVKYGVLHTLLFMDEFGRIGWSGIVVAYLSPVIIVGVFWLMFRSSFNVPDDTRE